MIYFCLCAASSFLGMAGSLGSVTLLRPLLDTVSPLSPNSVSLVCTMAILGASLTAAFFALNQPLKLHQDELILLAGGSAAGGVIGDLIFSRFIAMLPAVGVVLLQNALFFVLLALPVMYFKTLSKSIRPLALTRLIALPVAFLVGLFASFLSFGAEPLTIMLYFLLFDAENDEASTAALTVALFSMAGKMITLLIRSGMDLPDAQVLLFILPAAVFGTLLSMIPRIQDGLHAYVLIPLFLSLYTSLINVTAAIL